MSNVSCFDRIQAGFALGAALGLGVGGVIGGINNLRLGLRGRKLLRGTAMQMLGFGMAFGAFLAVGSGMHCEPLEEQPSPAQRKAPLMVRNA